MQSNAVTDKDVKKIWQKNWQMLQNEKMENRKRKYWNKVRLRIYSIELAKI